MSIHLDLGAVPDWIAAIGASVALVFARSAAQAAQRTNDQQANQLKQLEKAEARREHADHRRAAENMSFWIIPIREEGYKPAVRVLNSNQTPIYQLRLYCWAPYGVTIGNFSVMSPSATPRILARFTDQLRELLPDGPPEDLIRLMNDGHLLLCGAFRDSANQWWFRGTDGHLKYVTDEQAPDRLCREHLANLT